MLGRCVHHVLVRRAPLLIVRNDRSIKWSLVKSGRVNKRRWRKKHSRQLGEVVRCSGFVASSFLQHPSGDDVNFNDFKGESVC